MTRTWIPILLTLLLFVAGQCQAGEKPLILLSGGSNSYLEVNSSLNRLGLNQADLSILDPSAVPALNNRIVIAVGTNACRQAVNSAGTSTQVICNFLPSNSYASIAKEEKAHRLRSHGKLTALFLDQPLRRQMQLGMLVKPHAKSIGTLLADNNYQDAEAFRHTAKSLGLTAEIGHINSADNPVEVLSPVIEHSDLFLPLPGRTTATGGAAKWILYLTLRNGVPLIGFSKGYADAGAVVALYTGIDQIAQETLKLVHLAETGLPLPAPSFPQHFELSVNTIAARNLGIRLPPRQELERRLTKLERP